MPKKTFTSLVALGMLAVIPLPESVSTFWDDAKTAARNITQPLADRFSGTFLPPGDPVPAAQVIQEVGRYRQGYDASLNEFEVGDCGVIHVHPSRKMIDTRGVPDCDPQLAGFSVVSIQRGTTPEQRMEWYQQNPGAEVISFTDRRENPEDSGTRTLLEVDVFKRPGCRIQKETTLENELLITSAIYDCNSLTNSPDMEIVEYEYGPGCEDGCLRVRSDEDLANADN